MAWQEILIVLVYVVVGLANLSLGIYTYSKDPSKRLNKSFFYFAIAISLWCFSELLSMSVKNIFSIRLTYAAPVLVVFFGVFVGFSFTGWNAGKVLKGIFIIPGIFFFFASIFTPLIIKEFLKFYLLGYDVVYGPLFMPYVIYVIALAAIALGAPVVFMLTKRVDEKQRKQILYFVLGTAIFAFWSIIVSLIAPLLGFSELNNFTSPTTIFVTGFTCYAIVRFQLMDISSLLFTAFVYASVIVLIIAFLLLLVFASSYLFVHSLFWVIYIIIAVVSIVLFFIGRLFFVEKRDLEKAKVNLTESLANSEENRIKAEMERDKTATIISSFSDGLILLDDQDRIFSINYEAERVLNLEPAKLLQKPFQSLADFQKAVPVATALAEGLGNISKKQIELAKDFTIELSVIPLNLDQKDIGHLIVLHDVSREKIVENMKTEFVSLAAHQLRTPLSIIKWSMSMLKGGDFGKLNAKQNKIITSAFKNNERLISLVNDLLNVTRIEEGRYLYKVAPADMKEIVSSVLAVYKDEIKKRKIKIEFNEPQTLPQTMIDSEKMKLAVQNLVDNAIKYSPEGSKIVIALNSNRDSIEFGVQDFGMGIPQSQQDKIFKKFFRGDNAEKVNTVGSGLGLFLVQNIVEAHDGKIWFESEENKGTTFHISLPIKGNGVQ